jgi:hypothetical protein
VVVWGGLEASDPANDEIGTWKPDLQGSMERRVIRGGEEEVPTRAGDTRPGNGQVTGFPSASWGSTLAFELDDREEES